MPKNVLGEPLESCSMEPLTGWTRNGSCETGEKDIGSHTICVRVTDAFLDFSIEQGNDLSTPMPEYGFPGLRAGDRWCVCAARWKEACEAGCAPRVMMRCTHEKALETVPFEDLKTHAIDLN